MDAIITVLLAAYFTAAGYGWISLSKDPVKNAEAMRRVGPIFRILGPIALVAGLLLLLSSLVRS